MRWDALLHPVGPLPPSAYWLRRAVVLAAAVLAIVLLVLIGHALGGSGGGNSATRRTVVSPSSPTEFAPTTSLPRPTASASPTAPGITACVPADLKLAITTSAASYPSGSTPQLEVSLANTAKSPCSIDVGARARTITITSGSDRVWSSADCGGSAADPRTLLAGQTITLASSWDRRRSEPGCATASPAGERAATGVYVATVKLGAQSSAGAVFRIS